MQFPGSWLPSNLETLERFGALWVALGVASLVLTLLALPAIVLRLPADYFVGTTRSPARRGSRHPAVAFAATLIKNLLGVALIVLGAVMLFVPGQGVLTMLIGVLLTNFPGKYRLERALVRRPAVLRALNRIRRRAGHDPLLAPDDHERQ